MAEEATAAQQAQPEMEFVIQRIYTKDVSFESPNAPLVFTQEWNPETSLNMNTSVTPLEEDYYEVELMITITVKSNGATAFLAEVKQAGVFLIRNYAQDHLGHLLASYCPSSLFPYAREAIAGLISRGGFPEMHLSPINFDALYAQRLQEQQAAEEQEVATAEA